MCAKRQLNSTMQKRNDLDNPVKFKPDYKWPKKDATRN